MRLSLNAESKNKVGYTPDWLRVSFDANGHRMELTLDIQGEIGYDEHTLYCSCKGDLIPWVLCDCETGDEVDLYSLTDEQVEDMFADERIAKIICDSEDYEIGIYPVTYLDCDEEEIFQRAKDDSLGNCEGFFEMFVDGQWYEKEFKFETDLNV